MPNCSAITYGEWFGSITPPAPRRMRLVFAPMWLISTAGDEETMLDMLWCSAYQMREYPKASACWAKATERCVASPTDSPG